jgi:hypothetical protein
MKGSGKIHAPAALSPGKELLHRMYRRLDGLRTIIEAVE